MTVPAGTTAVLFSLPVDFGWLQGAVETATGPVGLVIIAVYSFLIAIVLPLPSELVLVAPLNLGLPEVVEMGLIILVSGLAKALGSVVAFYLGHEAQRRSGPIIQRLRTSRFDIVERSERQTLQFAHQYGYIGMALALMIPFFPDTLSIYAFTVLEENYMKFAAATFVGSVGRLLITVGVLAPFFSL
ncbi:MAG TPA: VTT domain-containing protein [Halococcus sp.]|nr:VTT domain-containing protein [Halococcus sp.]